MIIPRKLSLDELQVGMTVNLDDLSDVYDTIIIVDKENVGDKVGVIRYIGKEKDSTYRNIYNSCRVGWLNSM